VTWIIFRGACKLYETAAWEGEAVPVSLHPRASHHGNFNTNATGVFAVARRFWKITALMEYADFHKHATGGVRAILKVLEDARFEAP
jgi:hypothetical protein